jgi:hypothetical protein
MFHSLGQRVTMNTLPVVRLPLHTVFHRHGIAAGGALVLLMVASGALAQEPPAEPVAMSFTCDGLYRSQVYVDAQHDDWDAEAQPAERIQQLIDGEWQYDWTGPNDASFKFWCRHSEHGLYFAVVGRDNVIVAPDGGEPGDRVEVWLELDQPELRERDRLVMVQVPLWPALTDGISAPEWGYGLDREGELTASRAEVTSSEGGFFAEFNIPYAAIGNYPEPYAPMRFAIVQRDWDNDAEYEDEVGIGTAAVDRANNASLGELSFQSVEQLVAEIRQSERLDDSVEPFAAQFGSLGGSSALDVAFVLGDKLIIAGAGFGGLAWSSAQVHDNDRQEPVSLTLVDVDRDEELELAYRYREPRRGEADQVMVQEVVSIFDITGGQLSRIIFQEVANEVDGVGRFESEMRVAAGIVSFRKATEGTLARSAWFDPDAETSPDFFEMLNPWDSGTRVVWTLQGSAWTADTE